MNTNITTDNYEAYLLDYMEGNLSPDEAEQLKAFVVAQGLDWNELTEDLPHLKAPQIKFEGKEHLKKKGALVPLYIKIASAAAAHRLLMARKTTAQSGTRCRIEAHPSHPFDYFG